MKSKSVIDILPGVALPRCVTHSIVIRRSWLYSDSIVVVSDNKSIESLSVFHMLGYLIEQKPHRQENRDSDMRHRPKNSPGCFSNICEVTYTSSDNFLYCRLLDLRSKILNVCLFNFFFLV